MIVKDVHLGDFFINMPHKGTLVFDIDGTVADIAHRRKFVATKPKNWPAFEKTMHLDTVIEPIAHVVRTLHAAGWRTVGCSGRGAQNRDVTVAWLKAGAIPHHALYMRAAGDYRADNIIKAELLAQMVEDGFHPTLVIDDRNQVVNMWRSHNIQCVQVAEGDF